MHNLAVGTDIYSHCRKYQQLETKMNFYDGNSDRKHTTKDSVGLGEGVLASRGVARVVSLTHRRDQTQVPPDHPPCDLFVTETNRFLTRVT